MKFLFTTFIKGLIYGWNVVEKLREHPSSLKRILNVVHMIKNNNEIKPKWSPKE